MCDNASQMNYHQLHKQSSCDAFEMKNLKESSLKKKFNIYLI